MKKWNISKRKLHLLRFLIGIILLAIVVWGFIEALNDKENSKIFMRGVMIVVIAGWLIDYWIKYRSEIKKMEA